SHLLRCGRATKMETRNGAHCSEVAMMLRRVRGCGPEACIRPGTAVGQIHYLCSHRSKGRAHARSMRAHEHSSPQPGGTAHEKARSHSRGCGGRIVQCGALCRRLSVAADYNR